MTKGRPERHIIREKSQLFDIEAGLLRHFERVGPVRSVSVPKKDKKNPGKMLSLGFGFVQYRSVGMQQRQSGQ